MDVPKHKIQDLESWLSTLNLQQYFSFMNGAGLSSVKELLSLYTNVNFAGVYETTISNRMKEPDAKVLSQALDRLRTDRDHEKEGLNCDNEFKINKCSIDLTCDDSDDNIDIDKDNNSNNCQDCSMINAGLDSLSMLIQRCLSNCDTYNNELNKSINQNTKYKNDGMIESIGKVLKQLRYLSTVITMLRRDLMLIETKCSRFVQNKCNLTKQRVKQIDKQSLVFCCWLFY